MSRSLAIGYRDAAGKDVRIDVSASYHLFGTQRPSMAFWSQPRLREIGIERLTELGVTDPVFFHGWEEMPLLKKEIDLLLKHLPGSELGNEVTAAWLANLVFCYTLLVSSTPKDGMPYVSIG